MWEKYDVAKEYVRAAKGGEYENQVPNITTASGITYLFWVHHNYLDRKVIHILVRLRLD